MKTPISLVIMQEAHSGAAHEWASDGLSAFKAKQYVPRIVGYGFTIVCCEPGLSESTCNREHLEFFDVLDHKSRTRINL